jgi:hypothetical protein
MDGPLQWAQASRSSPDPDGCDRCCLIDAQGGAFGLPSVS